MKPTKKISVLVILLASLIALPFQSCKTLNQQKFTCSCTKADMISQSWKVDKYKINEGDFTSLVTGYSESYNADGTHNYSWGMLGGGEKWEFKNNETEIMVTGSCDEPTETYHVIKLDDKKLWYYYMDGKDKKEVHLVSNN